MERGKKKGKKERKKERKRIERMRRRHTDTAFEGSRETNQMIIQLMGAACKVK